MELIVREVLTAEKGTIEVSREAFPFTHHLHIDVFER